MKKEHFQEYLYGVRKICYWSTKAVTGKKGFKKESDVFQLEIDEQIKKAKAKQMKPIQVIRY